MRSTLILFATAIVLLSSCKKDPDPTPATSTCNVQSDFRNGGDFISTYSYDSQGKLLKVIEKNGTDQVTISRNAGYTDVTTRYYNATLADTMEYTARYELNASGNVVKEYFLNLSSDTTSYFYNAGGNLIKRKISSVNYFDFYSWKDGNVHQSWTSNGNDTITYKYDLNKSIPQDFEWFYSDGAIPACGPKGVKYGKAIKNLCLGFQTPAYGYQYVYESFDGEFPIRFREAPTFADGSPFREVRHELNIKCQ